MAHRVFRTYFINNRGDEQMGSTWNYLDITISGTGGAEGGGAAADRGQATGTLPWAGACGRRAAADHLLPDGAPTSRASAPPRTSDTSWSTAPSSSATHSSSVTRSPTGSFARPADTAQKSARPAGCGPSTKGDAVALGAHSGSLTALIAASAKSLSARTGVAPYLPARYLRPIASSMRGLRSESAYSLLAPS
jgi:hypothetical protein